MPMNPAEPRTLTPDTSMPSSLEDVQVVRMKYTLLPEEQD